MSPKRPRIGGMARTLLIDPSRESCQSVGAGVTKQRTLGEVGKGFGRGFLTVLCHGMSGEVKTSRQCF
jgi:hypothetical protein